MMFRPSGRARLYGCIAAANHGTTLASVFGESRQRPDVKARWEMWRRMRADGLSLSQIARATNRDHTTVLHGLRAG
jgi:chromosomal replication initiation ATPase DnaA